MAFTELRAAAQQALEALDGGGDSWQRVGPAIDALKAALAEPVQEHDLSRCPKCNGPADNGHDREVPPNPYYCTKCMAEPVAWLRVIDEAMVTHHLGVADPGDDYETAKRKMNTLLSAAQDIGTYFAKQAEPAQEPQGCDHCNHWLYAATRCRVCGRVTEPTTEDSSAVEPVQEPFGYLWPTGRHPEFRFTRQKRDGVDGMPLYAAPPQRKPLTDEEISEIASRLEQQGNTMRQFARAVERAHGIGGEG